MKIGLCGTMSVGKTTLVNALKELPEFKDYITRTERSKELMSQGIPLNTDSTLKGQCVFLAERTSELMVENIITDRTVVDVMAFANCSTSMDIYDKEDFETLAARLVREYDYIFYVSPEGVEIEDNGVRETDAKYRVIIDRSINALLNKYNHRIKNLHTLSGSTKERIELIKQAISL
tara:strand:- start:87 stop:617 length:531 start_codon:yes stop_codon:yes gene_type:complete